MVEDWTGLIFGTLVLILITVIFMTILLVGASYLKARSARHDEQRLEQLVARYEELLARSDKHNEAFSADMADVRGRVVEIERMLREVD